MVDIITPQNRCLYQDQLDEMFRLRYDVAVNYLKWPLPDAKDGLDIDQFDRDDTIYLIDYAKNGRMIACARLNPTAKPTLLSEVFSNYCDLENLPVASDIYEFSRFLVTKRGFSNADFIAARTNIMLAVNEFCVAYGIKKVTFLTYMDNYPITTLVWDTLPLGTSKVYAPDKKEYIAGISSLSERTLERARRLAGKKQQVSSMVIPLIYAKQIAETTSAEKIIHLQESNA